MDYRLARRLRDAE